jgi:hypothetical protein
MAGFLFRLETVDGVAAEPLRRQARPKLPKSSCGAGRHRYVTDPVFEGVTAWQATG